MDLPFTPLMEKQFRFNSQTLKKKNTERRPDLFQGTDKHVTQT